MSCGRPLVPLTLTDEQQDQLNGSAHSATLPHALVQRAGMILASAEGSTNAAVARRVGVTPQTVGKWRRRFRAAGIQGLHDELRPGRPRTYDDDKVAGAHCLTVDATGSRVVASQRCYPTRGDLDRQVSARRRPCRIAAACACVHRRQGASLRSAPAPRG